MAPRARTNGTSKRRLYLDLLHELHAASERAIHASPMNLTFSRPWSDVTNGIALKVIFLPPSHSLPSRYPPIHPSIDRPATIARTPLPRSLCICPLLSLRGLRGSQRTSERAATPIEREGGGRDPEGANNAHDEECALATLINEVLRLNGGTVSSVRPHGWDVKT